MRFDEKKKRKKKNSISTNLPIIQQEKKKKVGRSDKRAKLQTTSVTREYYLTSNGERANCNIPSNKLGDQLFAMVTAQ